MSAGVIVIYAGIALFLLGLFCLWRFNSADPALPNRKFAVSLCLLIANFFVAAAIVIAAIFISTSYTVIIVNESGIPLDAVMVSGGGVSIDFGQIPIGNHVKRTFYIDTDGELNCQYILAGANQVVQIDGYVTGNLGGYKRIRIRSTEVPVVEDVLK